MPDPVSSETGLVALLDRLLDTGMVVAGQVTIRLADIDLVDLDARALLTSTESARQRTGASSRIVPQPSVVTNRPLPPTPVLPERIDAEARGEDGIARLVLVVVELLRQVLTSQAIARVEGGSLRDDEVERLGRALMLLEQRCEALREFLTSDPTWSPFPVFDRSPLP